jgi:hypothetical protein
MQPSQNTGLTRTDRNTYLELTKEDLERNLRQIEGKSGFFSLDVSYVAPDDTFPESRIFQSMVFHPLDPEAACPCGSGEVFGICCRPLGLMRVFTLNPDGNGYSPMVFYSETWESWTDQDKLRGSLKQNEAFLAAADSGDGAFWNYPGEKLILQGPGPLIFGTVELTPNFLKIEGASRVCHANLRSALERALGEPLPAGKLDVELPVHNKSGISTGRPGAVIEEYRILRERFRKITSRAKHEVIRDELICAAKDLKMLGPGKVFVFDDESETDLLIDYSLFDIKRHGESIIQHFMRKNPPADQQDELLYQGFANPLVSVFQIEEITPGFLYLRDLLVPERKIQLADFNLSSSGQPGFIFFTRILLLPCFAMTSGGWGFVIDESKKEDLLTEYLNLIGNSQPKARVAQGILFFKKHTRPFNTSPTLP